METIEILAFNRTQFGRSSSYSLRREGYVPGVLYGRDGDPRHFYIHGFSLKPLVSTAQAYFIDLNIQGTTYQCILQEVQYHPVSSLFLHVDFLRLSDRPIRMEIPVVAAGVAPGVAQGGKLQLRLRNLRVRALPQHMPSTISVDVTSLGLGASLKIADIPRGDFQIQHDHKLPVIGVQIPRALRSAAEEASTVEAAQASTEG